jgi:hypothetical protein
VAAPLYDGLQSGLILRAAITAPTKALASATEAVKLRILVSLTSGQRWEGRIIENEQEVVCLIYFAKLRAVLTALTK